MNSASLAMPIITSIAAMLHACITANAQEPVSVRVKLWNKSDGTMGIKMNKASVPNGPVEFEITNSSKELMHEFLIAPWHGPLTALPYNAKSAQVKEDQVPILEGQEDMKPGLETTLRLVLQPGSYVVFCNQPGHYKMGMYSHLNVSDTSRR